MALVGKLSGTEEVITVEINGDSMATGISRIDETIQATGPSAYNELTVYFTNGSSSKFYVRNGAGIQSATVTNNANNGKITVKLNYTDGTTGSFDVDYSATTKAIIEQTKTNADNAKASATAAADSANVALDYSWSALNYANLATDSAEMASSSAKSASKSATNASTSETNASTSEANAKKYAEQAQSLADLGLVVVDGLLNVEY